MSPSMGYFFWKTKNNNTTTLMCIYIYIIIIVCSHIYIYIYIKHVVFFKFGDPSLARSPRQIEISQNRCLACEGQPLCTSTCARSTLLVVTWLLMVQKSGKLTSSYGKYSVDMVKPCKLWDIWWYCWWFQNPANQLRLAVYPIIYRVAYYIPGG